MKIILISPLLQPYRISFYEKLSMIYDRFSVYYNYTNKEDGRPQHKKQVKFNAKGFPETKISLLGFDIRLVKGMFRSIKEEHPDLIIIQGFPGNITYRKIVNWASRNKIKVVFWYCGWEPNNKRLFILKLLKKKIALSHYKKGDYFITYSSKAKEDLIEQCINPSSISIAYNGIELDNYYNIDKFISKAKELRKKYSDDKFVFLFVGGLIEEKRVLFLADTFNKFSANYPDAKLWIIGDGPQRAELENKIADNSNIRYFGRIFDGVESFFLAADIFILPGTGGLALNQAMYFNTPCIVGRADGTEKDLVLPNISGFNFVEDDKDSLLSKLIEAYNLEKEELSKMKEKCREIIVERNNVNNMVRVFKNVLDKIKKDFEDNVSV